MRKYSKDVILSLIILLVVAGYIIIKIVLHIYQQHMIDNNRYTLLCETLKPGMSISEVSDILNRKGNIIIRKDSDSIGIIQYSLLFTDEKEQDLYGGWFELDFVEGKYSRAFIPEFDHYKEICDFGVTPN